MINILEAQGANAFIGRINQLNENSQPLWGKMSVGQMLAHCNVTYEMVYTDKHPKPNPIMRFILKTFVKNMVVGDKPFKKNIRTAPQFLMTKIKVFKEEQKRLIEYIKQTQALGEAHFDGKESHSFGKLNKTEWNNMFAKHLNHHLEQFGV